MKYIVVAGYHSDDTEFIQCIGVFDNVREAYGEALLYLNEEIDNADSECRDKLHISPLFELESQTGFGMIVEGVKRSFTDYANILFWDEKEDHGKHKGEEI